MCYNRTVLQQWHKICRKLTGCFKNDKRNFVNFSQAVESLKIWNFMSSFLQRSYVSPYWGVMKNLERTTLIREREQLGQMHQQFSGSGKILGQWLFDYFYFFENIQ